MILSDRDIKFRITAGVLQPLRVEPFDLDLVQPASLDIRLGYEFLMFPASLYEIDPSKPIKMEQHEVNGGGRFIIPPNGFVLGSTLERFEIPNDLVGRIEGRSSLGRLGLLVHATAGYVDPGFKGFLTLEIHNLINKPCVVWPEMVIGQISFIQMTSPAEHPYEGRYQNQEGAEPSKYRLNREQVRALNTVQSGDDTPTA